MTIVYSLNAASGLPQKESVLKRTLLHELGHALGLLGHSPNPDDIMSEQTAYLLGNTLTHTLSEGDKTTLRLLYSSPNSCGPS
jgi:predicted Zn-dependent protease